ncbi:hypothetical protein RSOLAG1IB_07398 [Rhizoctonia solani AG-1 IB]|uniref:Uncharacterized protein n=1 Tax=Thanatephorus cucumeris (strain AG1-IB / isolate 7/3/14) TaxID=1108050 RepID=A0A0B7FA12_THACB|nr:hypothetical protein RSOLAG1IB_07398 [Rhizoctonia solani AG-1 IB]
MGQSRRTRDIKLPVAPNTKPEPSQVPSGSYGGLVAQGLKAIPGICNGSIRFIEEHLPDDLKSFDDLLGPLIRCNEEIVTKINDWTHTTHVTTPNDIRGSQPDAQAANRSRILHLTSSSRRCSSQIGGLVMDARELCKIWAGCATNRFQLTSFQWFKNTAGARHEYLIFKLESNETSNPSRKDLWLRLERRPTAKLGESRRKLWGQFTADDLITLSPRREDLLHPEDTLLEPQASATFSEKLSLRYLVDVLDIIHRESMEYHIAGANCWFYASTIVEIMTKKWFRDTAGARHEYLLFKLESGESPACSHKEMWLRLERCPSNKARASKRALVGSLFGQFAADDLITLSPRREDLFRLECTSTVPQASAEFSQKLPLRYLVDVLDIIHKESPEYHIAGANCWFYASTIAEVVSKEARAVWKSGDISYLDHRKSKEVVNFEQYGRIMSAVRRLRGGLN